MSTQKFYLTTPIYYVNARPHIGHAYSTIAADVIARRHRLLGDDTFFLTGTDEHGQKVERSAEKAGVPPQQFTDEVSASFRALWDRMGITYDDYIRTTEKRHTEAVQKLWKLLEDKGAIYLSTYTGQYSVGEEMFVEGPPGTIGPDGKPTETVTEENYFFRLSEYQVALLDLIESDTLVIRPETARNEVLSFVRGNVAEATSAGSATALSKQGNTYVPGALKDLSISRTSFKWGIPVPGNEKHVIYVWLDALANYITAIGYGSDDPALQERFNKYWPADLHLVGKEITRFHCVYWPAFLMAAEIATPKSVVANGWLLFEDSKMSKSRGNVVRTETILDAFGSLKPEASKAEQDLFAADVLRYFLLREIPFGQDGSFSFDALVQRYNSDLANGYGNLASRILAMIAKYCNSTIPNTDREKIETVSDQLLVLVEIFPKLFNSQEFSRALEKTWTVIAAIDGYITSQTPWKTGSRWDSLQKAIFIGISPENQNDTELQAALPWNGGSLADMKLVLQNKQFEGDVDEFVVVTEQLTTILYTAAESIRMLTALLHPILPDVTAKVWKQLGLGDIEEAAKKGELKNLEWGGLKPGTKLGELAPVFPRADKGLIEIMSDMEAKNTVQKAEPPVPSKLVDEKTTHTSAAPVDSTHPGAAPRTSGLAVENPGAQVGGSHATVTDRVATPPHQEAAASGIFATEGAAAGSAVPDSPQISIDDFVKIDLRVAQIVVAERIPKADKLLRLEVDLGYEKRQILSGIAEWYTPEELIGRRIVVIANLAPRKMRGLESHGMLLAASHGENGKPVLATFGEEIALGSRLK